MKTNWNLDLILTEEQLKNTDKLRVEVEKFVNGFIQKWKNDDSYLQDPKKLKEALDELEIIHRKYGYYYSEYYYRLLENYLDKNNSKIKSSLNLIRDKSVELGNEMQFFEINLSKINHQTQEKFLTSPVLSEYRHFLEVIFKFADHTLSEAEEKIMSLKSKTSSSNWVDMINSLMAKQEQVVLNEDEKEATKNYTEIYNYLSNKNKKVRDRAAKVFNGILEDFKDFAEHEINSIFEDKKVNDKIRGYNRADQSRHLSDDVETDIVDNLIQTVTENFDISKKYYELKSKLLGVDKLQYHERNIEYGEVEKKYKFEEGFEIVDKVFKNLDPEFSEIYNSFFEKGQVDVFPKTGKEGGAFCISILPQDPIYVLLNYSDEFSSVTTMAHEFGHAFHSHFSAKTQNSLNSGYPYSAAETASTFFEDFVIDALSEEMNDEQRLIINMQKLNDEVSTIIRQIACYNFEFELHNKIREKGYLSSEEIGALFTKHMQAYMGDFVEQTKGSENWWISWPHIRKYFYVFSYAFGLIVSKSFQKMVKEDPKNIKKFKKFLTLGSSESPKDIFMELGIDISKKEFWQTGMDETRALLEETIELAKKLKKF